MFITRKAPVQKRALQRIEDQVRNMGSLDKPMTVVREQSCRGYWPTFDHTKGYDAGVGNKMQTASWGCGCDVDSDCKESILLSLGAL